MTQLSERRDVGARRVSVSTLVEVVGNVPGIPVFEAEAVDVSARGMHLRTAYLPQEGDPLVCRFENGGREILVEGVVAWRREHSRGGEFGVQFTALDSKSVESLRELCGEELGNLEHRAETASNRTVGSRVRLHIDGLGSPMKARVKEGSAARVQVGSSLEFLKLGRKLEVEDVEHGARRDAQIDGVSVIVDPSTRVPQLVVALRFEGAEDNQTPSPHASDVAPRGARTLDLPASRVTVGSRPPPLPEGAPRQGVSGSDSGEPSDGQAEDPEMRGKVAQLAERAGERAKEAGAVLAQASTSAARGALGLFQTAAERIGKLRSGSTARRSTSPPRTVVAERPRLRSQHGAEAAERTLAVGKLRLTKKTAGAAAVGTLVLGTALALSLRSDPEVAAAPAAAPAEQTIAAELASSAPAGGAVTANVPLFGPTPLATTEPAPLAPGPDALALEAAEKADAAALAPARAPDLEWADDEPSRAGKARGEDKPSSRSNAGSAPSKSATRPDDVAPWGRGRMKEPTIHRLRLDAPGAALQGNPDSTGFTVLVPTRKVMEPAAPIAKRDQRIARIRATNTAAGAQVSVRFKDSVPSYRVRLRKDYVELLISAPGSEAEPSSTKAKSGSKSSR